jgi:hypothetical protein
VRLQPLSELEKLGKARILGQYYFEEETQIMVEEEE